MYSTLINIFQALVASFILTYISIPPIVLISNKKHLFDVPNHRKLNKSVVPTLGGVGIFIGLTLGTFLFIGNTPFPELRYIIGSLVMLFFIGLKDDIIVIAPNNKLMVQMAVAGILVILGNIQITNLSSLFALNHFGAWLSIPLSFLILLFVINSINLIDGIDGLAASISALASGILGCWFFLFGHTGYSVMSFALTGSLLAFLKFNLWGGENKIFMGDTGSLILGGVLGILSIKFIDFNITVSSALHVKHATTFILALLIVPITDTLRVFTIRLYQKRSPFSADMNHIHHILIQLGMKHIQASGFMILYTLFSVSFSIVTQDYLSSTIGFLITLIMSLGTIGYLSKRRDKIQKRRVKQIQLTRRVLSTGVAGHEDPFNYISTSKRKIYQN